jgi:hypothetical protein
MNVDLRTRRDNPHNLSKEIAYFDRHGPLNLGEGLKHRVGFAQFDVTIQVRKEASWRGRGRASMASHSLLLWDVAQPPQQYK